MAEMIMEETTNNDCDDPSFDVIQIDNDGDGFTKNENPLMSDPYLGEEQEETIEKSIERFQRGFTDRYSNSGPTILIGSLDEALRMSLFHSTQACPIILLIYDDRSVTKHVFCEQVLCKDDIIDYLNNNFIVWPWDRPFRQITSGDLVEAVISSSSIEQHPLLICLGLDKGYVDIIGTIDGFKSHDETLKALTEAHARFGRRIEKPVEIELSLHPVANEGWSMSPSVLTRIDDKSKEFHEVKKQYVGHMKSVTISRVENPLWLSQYLHQKKVVEHSMQNGESERLLVFYCSQSIATDILNKGFHERLKNIPGRKYGNGFYFYQGVSVDGGLTSSVSSDKKRAILVCRVLVGRTCLGNWLMETCPEGYDSTTDQFNTFVIYANRSIYPKYLIKYSEPS